MSETSTGVIEGTVTDEPGAALPGVTVVLQSSEAVNRRVVITDPQGRFGAARLPIGRYQLSASLKGFATLVRKNLQVRLGATLELMLTLRPALIPER